MCFRDVQRGLYPGLDTGDGGGDLWWWDEGEGRYLIDKNPAKTITSGTLTGGTGQVGGVPGAGATFSGTNFPVSVFLATAQTIPSQAKNVAPGTVTVTIATSGVTAGFATNTAAVSQPEWRGVCCGSACKRCTAQLRDGELLRWWMERICR